MLRIGLYIIVVISIIAPLTLSADNSKSGENASKSEFACQKSQQDLVVKRFMNADKTKELRTVRQLRPTLDTVYAKVQDIFKQHKGDKSQHGEYVMFEMGIEPNGEISSICVIVDKVNDSKLISDLANLLKTTKFASGDFRFQLLRYPASVK